MRMIALSVCVVTSLSAVADCRPQDRQLGVTTEGICPEKMRAIFDEVKTPFKYGMIMEAPKGLKYDNPTVYRHNGLWCMLYIPLGGS